MEKKPKVTFFTRLKANKELLFLSIPGFIWFVLFAYLPMFGVIVSFKKFRVARGGGFFKSLFESEWVGFNNFKFLFASDDAFIIFRNTVLYNLVFIVLGIVLPIAVAMLLNEIRNKAMAKVYQSSMFLPYFLSWVVVSYCLFAFLNPEKGYFNSLLGEENAVSWYTAKEYWPAIIIIMSQWKGVGYNTVVYLASICGIDKTYYEAAVLDGASKWQQVKYITIPLLKPVITILLIMSIGHIFSADFGLFYQLPKNSGPLFPVTNVLDTYIFRALRGNGEIGMSSAAALFQSTVGFVLIMVSNKIVSKIDADNALF